MESITLRRTGQRGLRFTGEAVAGVETSANNASTHYSGDTGRSAAVTLYRTGDGRYVAAVTLFSQWQGEPASVYEAAVLADEAAVLDWLERDAPLPLWARDRLIQQLDLAPEQLP